MTPRQLGRFRLTFSLFQSVSVAKHLRVKTSLVERVAEFTCIETNRSIELYKQDLIKLTMSFPVISET
jgi:hypothetical protein